MTAEDDFDEIFGNLSLYSNRVMKEWISEIEDILKEIERKEMKDEKERTIINEPDLKGYVILGRFSNDGSLDVLKTLEPPEGRPLPETPYDLLGETTKETCEPLTDIFEEEDFTKIYVELPGKKEDIKLEVKGNTIDVEAKDFRKTIRLGARDFVDTGKISTRYNNGLLEITIPKEAVSKEKNAGKGTTI